MVSEATPGFEGHPPMADGHPVPLSNQYDFEEFLQELCIEHAVQPEVIMDICARYDERFGAEAQGSNEAAAKRFSNWLSDVMAVLKAYLDRQRDDPRFLRMTVDCFMLALGFSHLAGAENPTEIARNLSLARPFGQSGKQTARECFEYLRLNIGAPPLPGQRGEEGRRNMSRARTEQLTTVEK